MTEASRFEPVSWLLLERYALGEVSPAEAFAVERALASDPETRECFERIQQPVRLKPLPDAARTRVPKVSKLRRVLGSPWSMVVAAAAVIVLYVVARPTDRADGFPPAQVRTKGGEMALELVRNRDGIVSMQPTSFTPGDRFKVLFTCPPGSLAGVRVVVLQGKEVTSPLGQRTPVACGNAVPLPGAFSLTGQVPAAVCVVWGEAARGSVRPDSKAWHDSAVCAALAPER